LIFPGLGHAYAGAPMRAIGFAAPPLLAFALLGGVAIRTDRLELLGNLIQPDVLWAIFVVNIAFAIYRIAAVIDAWPSRTTSTRSTPPALAGWAVHACRSTRSRSPGWAW